MRCHKPHAVLSCDAETDLRTITTYPLLQIATYRQARASLSSSAQTFQRLLDQRVEAMSTAFRAALDNLREEIESQMKDIVENTQVAMENLAEKVQQSSSDWSDWSLLDHEEL